jgi:RNA polymerase sigma-70 factor (ECF subfamily)
MTEETHQALSDARAMADLAQGRIEALGTLYMRHGAMVRRALKRLAPEISRAELEELGQEVFLTLSDTATRYEERTRLRAWLYGIAVRKAKSWRRNTWLRRKLLGQHGSTGPGTSPGIAPSPEREVAMRQEATRVLSQLPSEQRDVLLLHAVEGFTGEEIAQILGIRPKTVWTRLHRARRAALAIRAEQGTAATREGDS